MIAGCLGTPTACEPAIRHARPVVTASFRDPPFPFGGCVLIAISARRKRTVTRRPLNSHRPLQNKRFIMSGFGGLAFGKPNEILCIDCGIALALRVLLTMGGWAARSN